MKITLLLIGNIITLFSCSIGDDTLEVTFEVDGMSIQGGMLWMGWPTDIGKALDELKGIESQSFNYEKRLFTIIYKSKEIDKGKIVTTIESVGSYTVTNWTLL